MKGSRLSRRYAAVLVILVSGALLASGLVELYFSSREHQAALVRLQSEQAAGAASKIDQFIDEIDLQMNWLVQPVLGAGGSIQEQRRNISLRLLRQAPAVTDVAYLDGSGREQLRISRIALNVFGSGADYSRAAKFLEAKAGKTYFSPVYFRNDSEPFITVAKAQPAPAEGVYVAEVNLKFIWDVVSRIKVGETGYAYVVDAQGLLIAHPNISLVLQKTDLSALLQVQAALTGRAPHGGIEEKTPVARDLQGRQVLASAELVAPVGWQVLVEQPLEEAFAPLSASIFRTVVLLVAGLAAAVLASLVLARRMVRPIQAIQAGAARLGAGALDQRIAVRTGDELEALADEFNRMAAQLQESYANLEYRVTERTRDLAEALREIEEKSRLLEVASRHKSEFLANMSHELRTPLNAVIGFSEVLLEKMFGDLNEKQEEYLQDILTSGQHLLSLINDILDLSKVEAGRMELELDAFSLAETLENGLTMIRERASRHGIALSLDLDPDIGLVEADERKVKQVVFNLLSNAVKFTPDGGQVKVLARLAGEEVQVAVQDTGIGVAAADQEHIFEEFRQVGQEAAAKSEGTGLGLTLSRKFVELHGGRIWVESRVGAGSTFTFSLPVRRPVEAEEVTTPEQPEPAPVPSADDSGVFLVVEDDQPSLDLLTVYLSGAGFRVAVARDGEEGLELARRLRPVGIALDVVLPRLDGWEFLARAKADPSIAHIPVIIVSILDERRQGLALGAADYLVKPVSRESFLTAVRRCTRSAEVRTS